MIRWRELHLQSMGQRSDTGSLVDVNKMHLLPGLDLSIGVDIWSMGVRPSRRMDGGGLSY